MMNSATYQGYLKPWMPLILARYKEGVGLTAIATELYDAEGVRSTNCPYLSRDDSIRSFSGLMRRFLDSPVPIPRVAKWRIWTPEKQMREFEDER